MTRFVAVMVAVGLAVSGCAAASGSGIHPEASEQVVAFVDRNWASIPEAQRVALEDRYLTWDEYEGAVLDAISCMQDQGIEVNGPYEVNDGRYLDYGFVGGPDDDQPCYGEHLNFVYAAWKEQQVPTGAELARVVAEYAACLTEAGFPPPPDADLVALEEFVLELFNTGRSVPAVNACVERYSVVHEITRLP